MVKDTEKLRALGEHTESYKGEEREDPEFHRENAEKFDEFVLKF